MSRADRLVIFTLDGQRYALPLDAVDSAVRAVAVTPLPKAPDVVLGIINVRGQVLPVISLRRRFRLPERDLEPDDYILLARTSRRRVALAVDGVEGVLAVGAGEEIGLHTILPGTDYVAGVVRRPDGLIIIHDLGTCLSLDEEHALAAAMSG